MRRVEVDEVEQQLRRHRPPTAPEALADRITAAVGALAAPATVAWSDRLWFSRAARLAWAAAVLLLLAAEIALAPGKTGPPRPTQIDNSPQVVGLTIDVGLDPSWSERLVAAEAPADSDLAEIHAAVNAL